MDTEEGRGRVVDVYRGVVRGWMDGEEGGGW